MNYVETYNEHHRVKGKLGSGSGDPKEKMRFIDKAGLSGSCLDYGCGWGMMAPYFNDYVGVDIAGIAISYAKQENPDKTFYVIRNGELDLGRKFDFAICLSVLTHAEDVDLPRIFSDLSRHTDVALIDLILGEGGDWSCRKRMPDVFPYAYEEIGKNVSKMGIEHTYYKVFLT